MLYSFTNVSAVAEEMKQFNDMLKLLTAVNDEYQHLLTENELLADSGLRSRMIEYSVSNTRSSNG